ncbi:cupin domain-containing protein [Rhodobacter capsulatus]|uniref:Cupin domain-containing protein n=1 Tax=Rhodobacter capsulatus TaxID=1061 RepID=A0A4U1JM07_RHOCA|nr:cupin domain-containing protein [Rhodobacter capsulatus]TKD15372.1 cupin domain-containing protein [Rhodobacter capsulatus]
MHGFVGPIERLTKDNDAFRSPLFGTAQMDLTLFSLRRKDSLGAGERSACDQFLRIVTGKGRMTIGATTFRVGARDAILIPAGMGFTLHNIGRKRLRVYAVQAHGAAAPAAEAGGRAAAARASTERARQDMISEGGPADLSTP